MAELTKDEVTRRCEDLVQKVAYAFYDSPYIIMLRVLVDRHVVTEKGLSDLVGIGQNDVRKYLGMLHVHRLVRRYVNKEKMAPTAWQQRQAAAGAPQVMKARDVPYWYLDYRQFADVVKYRIAMMRKAIDEKIKNEVGRRGYLCPGCHKTYEEIEFARMYDFRANAYLCEVCGTELVEDDPALHVDEHGVAGGGGGQDRMQRFNVATAPIRDALKSIEGARIPTINIVAWIAQHVVTAEERTAQQAAEVKRVDIRIGEDDGDAKRAQDAKDQREANVLPEWHTSSTVTGEKTSLGFKEQEAARLARAAQAEAANAKAKQEHEDDALAAHYANMDEDDEDDLEEADLPDEGLGTGNNDTPIDLATPVDDDDHAADTIVYVQGVGKRLAEVTEDDHDLMSPEEYEAFASLVV